MKTIRATVCLVILLLSIGMSAIPADAQPYVIKGYIFAESDGERHPVSSFSMRVVNHDKSDVLENDSQHIYRSHNYYQLSIGHPSPGWSMGDHIEIQVEGYGQWQGFSVNRSFVFDTYPYPPVNLTLTHPSPSPAVPALAGPSSGLIDQSYSFNASAVDPGGYNVTYGWDWDGDGSADEWSGLLPSGSICAMSHTWTQEGTYPVQARARNEYNATSNWSSPLSVTISRDTEPPSVWITDGPEGDISSGNVTFAWAGDDNISPPEELRYRYMLEGYSPGWTDWTAATTAPYHNLPSGTYTFKVKAKDGAGNVLSRTITRSFTVDRDTVPPEASILTGPSGDIPRRGVTFTWTGSDDQAGPAALVYSYRLVNHTDWTGWTGNTTVSYTDLATGSYAFHLRPKDPAGNIGVMVEQAFTVTGSSNDTIPPSLRLLAPGEGATVTGTTDIEWNTTDASPVTIAVTISPDNGTTWHPVATNLTGSSYRWDTTAMDNGPYLLKVWATDTAGNRNTTAVSVTVDNHNGIPAIGIAAVTVAVLAALLIRKKNH